MNDSLVTSIGAIIFGGGAVALFWRPLMSGLANIVTGNRATGEIITGYKDQVSQLKSDNALLREQNDELRARHDENIIRISALETVCIPMISTSDSGDFDRASRADCFLL